MRLPAIVSTIGHVSLALVLVGCDSSPSSPSSMSLATRSPAADAATGQPLAVLSYQSDPGDGIGQGQSATFEVHGGQVVATLDVSQSELRFFIPANGGALWGLNLKAPSGALVPRTYNNATRYPFQAAGVPGLDFSGSGRGCNELTGRFLVAEAVFSGTEVRRFHARFEQHCEGWSSALRGQLWIDVTGALPPPLPEFPPGLSSPTTFFSYESGPGDYIGQGRSETTTLSGMRFLARQTPNRPGVSISMLSTGSPFKFWSADFSAASGDRLKPGTYAGATRHGFNSGVPGLDVSGNGAGCNTLRGSFIVLEANYGPSGEVLRFHATFEQHCEGATPALRGEIMIAADPWR